MPSHAYQLTQLQYYVRDQDADFSNIMFEARMRSGDYFVTLITELEKLAELLDADGIPEATYVQRLSAELAYLDKHYVLQPK